MNRIFPAIVALSVWTGAVAQGPTPKVPVEGLAQGPTLRVPVEDDVVAKTMAPSSPWFYPAMMARYMEGDETLTDEHYFYLYYGHAYTPEYDAHTPLPGDGAIAAIFARQGPLTKEDALAVIEAGRLNMTVDPFSPGNINIMTYAFEIAGDSIGARISARRFRGVVGAITGSGTGLKERSPWHILRFAHAGDIVAARGLKVSERTVRSRTVEYVHLERNPAGVKGFFFDFGRVYWRPYEGRRVTKKSKWMFNGTPV